MAPLEAWGEDFLYGVETYDEGVAAFAAHYATTEPPRYPLRDGGELTAVSAGVAGWPAGHCAHGARCEGGAAGARRRVAAVPDPHCR